MIIRAIDIIKIKECQKKDWKKQHKDQCKKLQQVFVPPPPPPRGTELEAQAAGGSGGAAAAGAAGAETSGNEEPEFLCPICLDNAERPTVKLNDIIAVVSPFEELSCIFTDYTDIDHYYFFAFCEMLPKFGLICTSGRQFRMRGL